MPTQTEVPNELLDQLLEFLESAADDVNTTPLVQVSAANQPQILTTLRTARFVSPGMHCTALQRFLFLFQVVLDDLGGEFADCTTAALLNHAAFNHFLHDCARLAWKLILITPPLSLNTDKSEHQRLVIKITHKRGLKIFSVSNREA